VERKCGRMEGRGGRKVAAGVARLGRRPLAFLPLAAHNRVSHRTAAGSRRAEIRRPIFYDTVLVRFVDLELAEVPCGPTILENPGKRSTRHESSDETSYRRRCRAGSHTALPTGGPTVPCF
jgi:hypothetical protein